MAFDLDRLYELRAAVAAHGAQAGLDDDRLSILLVAVTELATNAIRHAGGQGRLKLWHTSKSVFCQVTDEGPGIAAPEKAGTHKASVTADSGRGLWIVRRFTDDLTIANNDPGTAITITMHLQP
jgi:anti-sigma regulatory factor (Ser/Thr protein kinase)